MKFDTIIIGGGLSGLLCGIQLSKFGKKCLIVSSGQSALHFSSGSFDLLNTLADGTTVTSPVDAFASLTQQSPNHPYVKLGKDKFLQLAHYAKTLLQEAGISVCGDENLNHYRVTPMGTLKSTWLTLDGQIKTDKSEDLPWKKIALFNVPGYLDFYTQFIADEFKKLGTESEVHEINLPVLETIRKNPTEMRSVNLARILDNQEILSELAQQLKTKAGDAEVIALPSIVGLNRNDVLEQLEKLTGRIIRLLPTLPPSVPGINVQLQLRRYFEQLGGTYMLGDSVLEANVVDGKVKSLRSFNHQDIALSADNFVLATGSFFSQGLIATNEKVYEPIFDLDVAYLSSREEWYTRELFKAQPYSSFGVKTDHQFHALHEGKAYSNLYAVGAVLEGFNAVKEGCGAGVSVLTALYAAEQILNK